MGNPGGRRPADFLSPLTTGQIRTELKGKRTITKQAPENNPWLGIAKVLEVNYEEFYVTLRTVSGTHDKFDRVPVPLTFPGAGARHFFGAMPQVGDYCIIGWMAQESLGGTRTPIILSWVVPGVWAGREWLTTQGYAENEHDMQSLKEREIVRGVADRVRHKLRHAHAGNIVASSSQGSDLVLDEGVTLANRRGNELRLRDQDQALVVRSLQQFHAMAGARIYSGMVQRDAAFLASWMVSDGKKWDGFRQSVLRTPVAENDLPSDPEHPAGMITPARVLERKALGDGGFGVAHAKTNSNLDPYSFLRLGGFISEGGFVVDSKHRYDAVYGGKPLFRVAAQDPQSNAVLSPDLATLTEWRLEVTHTSDGKLPVTEQTDMFDAERLPRTESFVSDSVGLAPNAPFLEVVYGSVVGNDPFTRYGRQRYGVPLRAVIFDGDTPNPRLDPISLVINPDEGAVPTPLSEHAATLFRLSPLGLAAQAGSPTFWSVTKGGQLRAFLGGPRTENSAEIAMAGGLKLAVAGGLDLLLDGGIRFGSKTGDAQNNLGVSVESETGAVRIYGGGGLKGPGAVAERLSGTGRGESGMPSVRIEGNTNTHLLANKHVLVKGASAEVNATSTKVYGHTEAELSSGDRVRISAKVVESTSSGKRVETFCGPKEQKTSNGPLHERNYNPTLPGVTCEKVVYSQGDRVEQFDQGDHSTTVKVGDMTYTLQTGKHTIKAGQNQHVLSTNDGLTASILKGDISLSSSTGSATLKALSGIRISATGGDARMTGASGVYLGAPVVGTEQGAILSSGTKEPFTNLPFSTWGLGAPRHQIGS